MDKLGSNCKYDSNKKQYNNVGTVCWIWIVLSTISYILLFIRSINIIIHYNDIKNYKKMKHNILGLLVNMNVFIIQTYFIYSMCKLCRGWTALGVIILISCIISGINYNFLSID